MAVEKTKEIPFFSVYKYTCSFVGCELQFRRKDQLHSYEYTHNSVKQFKCPEPNCDKSYRTSSHLNRHKRTFHAAIKFVQCSHESCKTYIHSQSSTEPHCLQIHPNQTLDFQCEICNEKFRRKTQLRQHMYIHTGLYKYRCEKCEKGFYNMGKLKRHEKSHRIRHCDLCDATFEKWSSLLTHRAKEHSNIDFKCTICGKDFHSKVGLKAHRKTHTHIDDRTVYPCTFEGCTKFFFQRQNMMAHYKLKHENRKFVCTFDDCKSELSTKQKLEEHIKKIHLSTHVKVPKKSTKPQAPRKDKGGQKRSTASKIFDVILPREFEEVIMAGHGKNIHLSYNKEVTDDADDADDQPNQDDQRIDLAVAHLIEVSSHEGVVEC